MRTAIALGVAAWAAGLACAAETQAGPAFAKRPTVTRNGAGLRIAFEADRLCDVAVWVQDAAGRVVRHLAAGVLGANPPAPLKAGSPAQSLTWDGKDDAGRPAAGGPFRARVGLGLRASWGGVAFADPNQTGPNRLESVMGLAAGPDGRLYVLDRCGAWLYWHGSKVLVFRRDGSYERTIMPFPPTLPPARVQATGAFVNSFGALNPVVHRPMLLTFYSHAITPADMSQQPAVTPDGRIVLAVRDCEPYYGVGAAHLGMIDSDGGLPEPAFAGPSLQAGWTEMPCLAAGGEGKVLYVTGLGRADSYSHAKPAHAVYRLLLPGRGPAEVFFGRPDEPGADGAHLSDPRGLAADGRGHLLVADFGNDRVVVLNESDGSPAGSFAAEAPTWVALGRDGTVYVAGGEAVVKLTSWKDPRPVARLALPPRGDKDRRFRWHFALDAGGERAVLWIGRNRGPLEPLLRCEDRGEAFSQPAPAGCSRAQLFWRPARDPTGRLVACRVGGGWDSRLHVLDEADGSVRVVRRGVEGSEGRTHRLGADGRIYAADHAAGIVRYEADGKESPFAATAGDPSLRGRLPVGHTGTTCWERDFSVARSGDIYVKARGPQYHGLMTVQVYDADGRFKRTALWTVSDGMYGPRLDAQGNLYVMEAIHPLGRAFPEELAGRFQTKGGADWCAWLYGSIIKFGPRGGAVWLAGGQASPVDFEGWRAGGPRFGHDRLDNNLRDLRTTGGCLVGTISRKPPSLRVPLQSLDADAVKKLSFRLKNSTTGTQAALYYNRVSDGYGKPARRKAVEVRTGGEFAEYTFDMTGEAEWRGPVYALTFSPADGEPGGTFELDWFRVGEGDGAIGWKFDAEDSADRKLPADMGRQTVGSYRRPDENVLQGALWWRFGYSPLGDMGRAGSSPHCHCTASDFDVDGFGRVFAPDTARFRVGVLDTNGNELLSFGAYGNQDFCGPDSYVIDPATKRLRPRRPQDPRELTSPFARPEIAFGWIVGLAVTDAHAYVDDVFNKRILRVNLSYAAEATAEETKPQMNEDERR